MLPYYHYVKTRFSTVTTVSGVVVFYRTHRQGVLVPPIRAYLSNPMRYETALRHNLTVGVIETLTRFAHFGLALLRGGHRKLDQILSVKAGKYTPGRCLCVLSRGAIVSRTECCESK